MSRKSPVAQIGFPPPLLGPEPCRLDILHLEEGLLALNKPSGVSVTRHPWYSRCPDLSASLQFQLERGKPELLRLGLDPAQPVQSVFNADPHASGVALLAWGSGNVEQLRNQFGSAQFRFDFHFIASGRPSEDSFTCDLPLAQHFHLPQMVVSHQTGKKTQTHFQLLERLGNWGLWQAQAGYLRVDQILLHAFECGLEILGESKYGSGEVLYLSSLKGRHYRGDTECEQPLYAFPALHLHRLSLPEPGSTLCCEADDGEASESGAAPNPALLSIEAPLPSRFANLLKQLRQHARNYT